MLRLQQDHRSERERSPGIFDLRASCLNVQDLVGHLVGQSQLTYLDVPRS